MLDPEIHGRSFAAVLDGVVDEVLNDLHDLIVIADDDRGAIRQVQPQRHGFLLRFDLQDLDDRLSGADDVDTAARARMLVQLDARKRHEIADQSRHPLGRSAHHFARPP